jgi:hypothetical protein
MTKSTKSGLVKSRKTKKFKRKQMSGFPSAHLLLPKQ